VGKAKTKGSKTAVVIPDILLPVLNAWLEVVPSDPATLLFPSSKAGVPMRPESWLRRRLLPVAVSLGVTEKVNFQILRRTFATNAQEFGSPKDVQTHLRHTHIATTMDVYTQPVDENVRRLVNTVHPRLTKSSDSEHNCAPSAYVFVPLLAAVIGDVESQ
jgi:integrase